MKSPTFYGKTVEVGPLANMLVKLAAGRESTQNKLNEIVAIYQKLTGNTLEVAQLPLYAGPYYWSYRSLLRIAGYPAKSIQCTDHQYR